MSRYTILCGNKNHPLYDYTKEWILKHSKKDEIAFISSSKEISWTGEFLFLLACSEIIKDDIRSKFDHTLVLHASDLPEGRGWSPYIWDIVAGKSDLTMSLLEAKDPVDTGDIWAKEKINIEKYELFDEINNKLFAAQLGLIARCINGETFNITSQSDIDIKPSYHKKRSLADSELDINKSIASQFDLLRVCDPNRYPAFIEIDGQKYLIKIEKFK